MEKMSRVSRRSSDSKNEIGAKNGVKKLKHGAGDENDAPSLICELSRLFYDKGWATGTGGGISIKQGDTIYVSPSGVHKERLHPDQMFELNTDGKEVARPTDQC